MTKLTVKCGILHYQHRNYQDELIGRHVQHGMHHEQVLWICIFTGRFCHSSLAVQFVEAFQTSMFHMWSAYLRQITNHSCLSHQFTASSPNQGWLVALWNIPLKLILKLNLVKSLSSTIFSRPTVLEFSTELDSTAVLNLKTIEQLSNKLRATKISRDWSSGRISYIARITKVLLVLIATLAIVTLLHHPRLYVWWARNYFSIRTI